MVYRFTDAGLTALAELTYRDWKKQGNGGGANDVPKIPGHRTIDTAPLALLCRTVRGTAYAHWERGLARWSREHGLPFETCEETSEMRAADQK